MQEINVLLADSSPPQATETAPQPDGEAEKFSAGIVDCLSKIIKAGRHDRLEASDKEKEQIVETLKQMTACLGADTVDKRIPECVECLTLGSRIVPEDNYSLALSLTTFKILSKAKVQNEWNLIEHVLVQTIHRVTNVIYKGYIIDFGQISVPKWVEQQMDLLNELVKFADTRFSESVVVQKASLNALFAISKKTMDLEKQKKLVQICLTYAEKLVAQTKLTEVPEDGKTFGPYTRGLLLDAAKIAYECELLGVADADIKKKKLDYARQAIVLDPQKAELWVHLHIFADKETEQQR